MVVVSNGAIHIIQRVQCADGVRVTDQAMHVQLLCSLCRPTHPFTLPCLPGLSFEGLLVAFCHYIFVLASAVLTALVPLCFWVV